MDGSGETSPQKKACIFAVFMVHPVESWMIKSPRHAISVKNSAGRGRTNTTAVAEDAARASPLAPFPKKPPGLGQVAGCGGHTSYPSARRAYLIITPILNIIYLFARLMYLQAPKAGPCGAHRQLKLPQTLHAPARVRQAPNVIKGFSVRGLRGLVSGLGVSVVRV